MASEASLIIAILAGSIFLSAAYFDIRSRTLPDAISILLAVLAILHWGIARDWPGMLWALACGIGVFALGALAFARGWLGGGDVKLVTASTFLVGVTGTPALLVIMSLAGGALSLMVVAWHLTSKAFKKRRAAERHAPEDEPSGMPTVPYGAAIACAGLYVLFMQYRLGVN